MRSLIVLATVCIAFCLAEICPGGQECNGKHGSLGCCPYNGGVCCDDQLSCCPKGTTCDVEKGACRGNSIPIPFKWMLSLADPEVYVAGLQEPEDEESKAKEDLDYPDTESIEAKPIILIPSSHEAYEDAPSPNGPVLCPDNFTVCRPLRTCCHASRIGNSTYGCCSVDNGVCCADYTMGCCDSGTVCIPGGCEARFSLGFGFKKQIFLRRRDLE